MNHKIEISTYGNLLIYKKDYTIDFVKQTIDKNNLNGLRIFDHLDPLESIDFLKDYTFLKALEIECINDHNFNFLSRLNLLERLSIGKSIKNSNIIDFDGLTNLKSLTLNWRKNKIENLEKCININELCLVEFSENNFSIFSKLYNTTSLVIKSARIKSLQGLNELTLLENISIGNCLSLKSIKSLNGLKKLKSLIFNKCSNIDDFSTINRLPMLEVLQIIDCGNIDSIQFVTNFPTLMKLSLLGNTVVLDKNLLPVKDINEVFFNYKEHYHSKSDNNNIIKANLNKLKSYEQPKNK